MGEVSAPLKKISYCRANGILRDLEEQAGEIRNPTAWIIRQCKASGANGTKEGRRKIESTIWWHNHEGGLLEAGKPIDYAAVAEKMNNLEVSQALKILHHLEKDKDNISNPTSWILGYIKRVENSPWALLN